MLSDGNQEPRLYQFESEEDYTNICTRRLRNEYSDPDTPNWKREEHDLGELEEMLMDESENHHLILYFDKLGILYMGTMEQTHTVICIKDSFILNDIEYIHKLADEHGLYSWKNKSNSWDS